MQCNRGGARASQAYTDLQLRLHKRRGRRVLVSLFRLWRGTKRENCRSRGGAAGTDGV
jgi:hypothetical protein